MRGLALYKGLNPDYSDMDMKRQHRTDEIATNDIMFG